IELTPAAKELVAERGYDPVYGARPLKRSIQKNAIDPLANELLTGRFKAGDRILVDRDGDRLVFRIAERKASDTEAA
ncbi:MAG: hypothetical protein D6689_20430, partial [Deltaproteobacteria bacterium]